MELNRGFGFAAIVLAVATARVPADDRPAIRTISSSGYSAAGEGKNSYGVSSTSLMARNGKPVACYGITKAKGEAERYAYFIVFKSPENADKQVEFLLGGGTELGETIEITESPAVVLGDRKWRFQYKLSANGDLTKVKSETLRIDGKDLKTSEGRVFLVDLTQAKPTCQALKIDPPKPVPDLAQKNEAARAIEEAMEEIKKRSKEVREFLEPAKK